MRQAFVILQEILQHCWLQRQTDSTHKLVTSHYRGTCNRSKVSGSAPGRACRT